MSDSQEVMAGRSAGEHVFQLCMGYMPSICLNVVARLSVADHLSDKPVHVDELARQCGANPDALYRVMRALCTVGVFHESSLREFVQTPASELLRTDHPESLRPFVLFFPDPLHFRCYANLMHSVRTGETVVVPTLGVELFEYMRQHPEESSVFNAAMANITKTFLPAVLQAYDFSEARVAVDVGGGQGSVIAALLQHYPEMRGVLFDLDYVVAEAKPYLEAAKVADRCRIVSGSFFDSVPAGGDTYVLKNIIHDWDDERCLIILGHIREALKTQPRGKLVLFEMVLAGPNEPHMSKWADIEMLALAGGRERTGEQFRDLLARAGFRLTRIVSTPAPPSVIEAVVAD